MVELFISDYFNSGVNGTTYIGFGTSTTALLGVGANESTAASDASGPINVKARVTGSGQTITVYVQSVAITGTVTFSAQAQGNNTHSPSYLSAVRVS
jgi:hypothetical protein